MEKQLIQESLRNEALALMALSDNIRDDYVKAISILQACRGKVIVSGVGKSGHIGKKIAASLSSMGTPAFFVHAAEGVHGDSGMIEHRDVVILLSNSGETAEVLNLLGIIKKIGSATIAITKNADSTLATSCDGMLTYQYEKEADHLNLAPTTSALLQLAIGDALAVALSKLKDFTKEDFHLYHPGGSLGHQLQNESLVKLEDK